MKKTIVYCDKCKKEIKEDETVYAAFEFDTCEKCQKKFAEYIKQFFNPTNEEKEEKKPKAAVLKSEEKAAVLTDKPKKRVQIDWDKACALKVAGWTNKAIAEELGVNPATINVNLYEHLHDYRNGKRYGTEEVEE